MKKNERSEVQLFEALIHEDSGNLDKAIEVLTDAKKLIVNQVAR